MKKVKRMLAVLLAAIMTLAMATTAFAAEAPKGSLTVRVNQNNTLEGQTIKVYKLFDLTVSESHYAYTVNETYKSAIATALGLQDTATSEELYEKLAKYTTDSAEIQKFADDFTSAALTAGTSETKASPKLGKVTEYKFENLDYGYYLVYQTGTKEIQSSLISVDKESVNVDLKGQAPSITKTADAETVEIGQVVTYTITGTIPDTTGYDSYVYKIKDTLTTGLDFVKNAQGTAQEDTNYSVTVQIKDGASSTQNAVLSGDDNRTMTLDLSQWIKNNQTSKGSEFTVTYYAKVNANAVVTEKNSASLEYGNDPQNTTTTTPSEAKTPTYPLQIHKLIKGQTSSYLAGATFRIYGTEQDAKVNTNPIGVKGSNGSYTVDKTSQEYDMVSIGDGTTVGTGMNLKLNGLKAGTYWLVETDAPDGYNGITAPIKITITKSNDTDVNNWTISKGDDVVEDKIIDIENSTGTILPGTGGMGTVLFTVVGVVLALLIGASFVISRRKRA
ncbi:MAG: SpaH/EbpB family LPXTG-anchored major pilin [[Ruminococcus] gnavus]|nr:SpaH/EbpB family LPXTG-anchored major pilin [Mediterraneibacter gnavus]